MPKRLTLFIIVCLIALQSSAQKSNTDSLWNIAETSNNDSLRLQAINTLYIHYTILEIDSNYQFNKRFLKLCDKLNTPRYKALGIILSSTVNYRIGDLKTVQEHITKASEIAEKNADAEVLFRIESVRSAIENDPYKKIEHLRKSIQYRTKPPIITLGNLSSAFLSVNQVDSAFFYAQKIYELSLKENVELSSFVTATMGNVYLKMNQPDIAYAFYKKGIKWAIPRQIIDDLLRAYTPMANYFNKINQPDSALYYWKKPFEYGPKEAFRAKLNASKKIYDYYFKKGNNDSAAKYMNYYIIANDSINGANKVIQLQMAKFEEELKQKEIDKVKAEDEESRNHNIQLAITAIAILSVIILFLLLSRSILVSHKVVEFLSVLVLLVVFEFINLLIHPFLERITHHSPVLMLLGLVAIASLIIPLHHRLEHWTSKKLVEKNKAIRLANAKKTIEEIESSN